FVNTDMNSDMKFKPFAVSTETAARIMFRQIAARPVQAFTPTWPWFLVARILSILPGWLVGAIALRTP
ncbi:hypothetical protein HK405_002530, partial [Cladochytrium tenue]